MTTMNEERAGYMPIPTAEQLAEALANVRCFHDLSAELIAPELLKNLLAAAPAHPAERQEQGEVQRLREALEHCLDVMKDPWKHGEGCISRAIYMADAALAAGTGQEVE